MKKLLKYIFPVIVAVAFAGSADGAGFQAADGYPENRSIYTGTYQTTLSESESEPCLPRQISFAAPHQVRSSARRINTSQRNGFEFTRSGKIEKAGIRYIVQTTFIMTRSLLADPACILLRTGKLII